MILYISLCNEKSKAIGSSPWLLIIASMGPYKVLAMYSTIQYRTIPVVDYCMTGYRTNVSYVIKALMYNVILKTCMH